MDGETVREIEERALKAWPALATVLLGGWEVRLSNGCTKRANSANALSPSMPFEDVRREVEAIYAGQGQQAIFRLTPLAPAFADDALQGAGYRHVDPSLVMAAPLAPLKELPVSPTVMIEDAPTPAWLDGIASANGIAPQLKSAHDAIVGSIATPAAFATVPAGSGTAGCGLAVLDRGWVGLFDVVVSGAHRGRGFGRAIAQTLLAWGRARGATAAYLQVSADNKVALGLYQALGFTEAYRYHYRVKDYAASASA